MKLGVYLLQALLACASFTSANTAKISNTFPRRIVSVYTKVDEVAQMMDRFDVLRGGHSHSMKASAYEDATGMQGVHDGAHLAIIAHSQEELDTIHALSEADSVRVSHDLTHRLLQRRVLQDANETEGEGTDEEAEEEPEPLFDFYNNFTCYRTVNETYSTVRELGMKYPDFVNVSVIGQSYLGLDILAYTLTSPRTDVPKAPMMIVTGHHSRELAPPEVILRWVEHLLANYDKDADITMILDRVEMHLVPMANPDGRQIVQDYMEIYYRKNAHPYGCEKGWEFDGVDLNRNYPMFWGDLTGASNDTCASSFWGGGPLSEPESTAVYDYARKLFNSDYFKGAPEISATSELDTPCPVDVVGLFIDVHSSGGLLYYPHGWGNVEPPNSEPIYTMASKLANFGDYLLWGPGEEGFLYPVSGDATDTTYSQLCIPSYGWEIGTQFYETCESLAQNVTPVVFDSVTYAAKTAHSGYTVPLGPDVTSVSAEVNVDGDRTIVMVSAVAADTQMKPMKRNITVNAVEVFVDVHPDDGGVVAASLDATDGEFDGSTMEETEGEIDASEWSPGRYTLFFRASDDENNAGPVTALFVEIPEGSGSGGGDGDGGGNGGGENEGSSSAAVSVSSVLVAMMVLVVM